VKVDRGVIEATATQGLAGCLYKFPKNSHTGTEALILAASLASGKTRLENAAAEPEVDELISFLNQMGAKIKRTSRREIEITGASSLKGAVHKVMPDRNEVVTFSCMALGTRGDVEIENANLSHVGGFIKEVKAAGGGVQEKSSSLRICYKNTLKPTSVATLPFPGFMTDWQSLWTALMTQAEGESVIHETIFENRFGYVPHLLKMGARIELFNPAVGNPEEFYNFEWGEQTANFHHAAKVYGSTGLNGEQLEVTDIRAGATLVFAALMAEGKSEITGIEHIERGYEDLEGRLERLGARIERVD